MWKTFTFHFLHNWLCGAQKTHTNTFLAALSSSRSLIVCLSVRPSFGSSVRRSLMFVTKWPLEYQKVIKTYLPTRDSSDSSDSSYSSESSDSSDQITLLTKSDWVSEWNFSTEIFQLTFFNWNFLTGTFQLNFSTEIFLLQFFYCNFLLKFFYWHF